MIIKNFYKAGLITCMLSVLAFSSCKKDKKASATPVTPTTPTTPVATTRADLTKDSLFLYAKQVYLWNDALPSYETFNPLKYNTLSSDLLNYNSELFDITQIKINPLTGKPYEYNPTSPSSPKYSYIFDSANKNPTAFVIDAKSSVDLEGNGNDFGIKAGLYGTNTSYKVYVQAVYPGSPAQKAGLTRGAVLSVFNGQTVGTNSTSEVPMINAALFSSQSVVLGGTRKDGTTFNNMVLNKAIYSSSPILKDTVLFSGSKKIGYLAFARFSSTANARDVLASAFVKFSAAGVNNLVIDLRYNGGGYVSTAEYLVDLVAPASLTGQTMFSEHYNSTMQNGFATILSKQPLLSAAGKVQFQNGRMVTYADINYTVAGNTSLFKKEGNLEGISNIVFIVSGNTASASELVINSLKPFFNVKLIGTTTYGKPVGFFPIRLENKYDVYYSMFQTKNALNEGEYFPGFTPDVVDATDDASHDFGDRLENYLAKAIGYISTGSFAVNSGKITISGEKANILSSKMQNLNEENEFKGMIENRLKLK